MKLRLMTSSSAVSWCSLVMDWWFLLNIISVFWFRILKSANGEGEGGHVERYNQTDRRIDRTGRRASQTGRSRRTTTTRRGTRTNSDARDKVALRRSRTWWIWGQLPLPPPPFLHRFLTPRLPISLFSWPKSNRWISDMKFFWEDKYLANYFDF